MLFDDDDPDGAAGERESIVAKAQPSPAARAKQTTGITPDGLPVHSFQTLLADLATYAQCEAIIVLGEDQPVTLYPRLTPIQEKAFQLLRVVPVHLPLTT
jgi:hypothetical protein